MRAIKNKKTIIEELLAKALRQKELRCYRNNTKVFGKPDFIFRKLKIAIFCDSEYFHGKEWEVNKHKIKTNTDFWQNKIGGNIARDKLVNETLLKDGWKVIRFWGDEIKKNIDFCIQSIEKEIENKSSEIHGDKGKTKNPTGKGKG